MIQLNMLEMLVVLVLTVGVGILLVLMSEQNQMIEQMRREKQNKQQARLYSQL